MKGTVEQGAERYEHIDALRGFALLGILFGNASWFSGTAVLSSEARATLGTTEIDAWTRWLIHVLVDGKFYSLFSLLFGVGFGLVMQRDPEAGGRFRRRMVVLFGIGGLHASLVWFGDIVSLYAVTGLLLPWCWRLSDRAMLRCAVALLAAPIPIGLAILVWDGPQASDDGEHGPNSLLPAFANGTVTELLRANWAFLTERWILALESGRFCKLLGMFLLGAFTVRRGIATDPKAHRGFLRCVGLVSLAVAVPSNLALAWFLTHAPTDPRSPLGLARTTTYVVAAPSMCLVYASVLTLGWRSLPRLRRAFSLAGRMSFTHYLSQSVLGATVFYGLGFGLSGRFGEAKVTAMLPFVFILQTALGAAWLHRFGAGPVEQAVRRLGPLNRQELAMGPGRSPQSPGIATGGTGRS